MNTYFLCATQSTNLGDLIINKMLVKELSKYGSVYVDCKNTPRNFADYLTAGNNVYETYNMYGISLKTGMLNKWARFLKRQDVKLYVTSPGPVGSSTKFMLNVYFRLVGKALKMKHIPEYGIGNCCSGALADNKTISFPSKRMVYLRSKKSIAQLKKQGIHNVSFIPDLAFLLHQYVTPSTKRKIAVVSLREVFSDTQRLNNTLCAMIHTLIERGYKIEFYYQVAADKSYNEKLASQFTSPNVSFREEMVWYDTLNYYADKMIVISNRLHSLITGAIYDVVPLALVNDDNKVSKIEDVFYSSLTQPQTHIAHNDEVNVLDYIIEHYDSVRDILAKDIENNCIECMNVIKALN